MPFKMMVKSDFRPWWAIVAVGLIAIVSAGATTALSYSAHLFIIQDDAMAQSSAAGAVFIAAFVVATPLIAAGLIVWGLPVWFVLRKMRLDSVFNSVLAGSLLSLFLVGAWYSVSYPGEPVRLDVASVSLLPMCILPGGVCAWIVRRFAYRQI